MKAYVFTVKEDICAANGKDVTATNLLEKMKLYGSVEDFDSVIAKYKAEYQLTVDNLNSQLEAIKSQKLTSDEIKLVKTYRDCKAATEKEAQDKIDAFAKLLDDIRSENAKRTEAILALLDTKQ